MGSHIPTITSLLLRSLHSFTPSLLHSLTPLLALALEARGAVWSPDENSSLVFVLALNWVEDDGVELHTVTHLDFVGGLDVLLLLQVRAQHSTIRNACNSDASDA